MGHYDEGKQYANQAAHLRPADTKQEPEVPRTLKNLESHLGRLKDAISELEQRLIPIRDNPPAPPDAVGKEAPVRTQLATAIHVNTMEVINIYGRVRLILDTLEL